MQSVDKFPPKLVQEENGSINPGKEPMAFACADQAADL
jgi:hypothetical protein